MPSWQSQLQIKFMCKSALMLAIPKFHHLVLCFIKMFEFQSVKLLVRKIWAPISIAAYDRKSNRCREKKIVQTISGSGTGYLNLGRHEGEWTCIFFCSGVKQLKSMNFTHTIIHVPVNVSLIWNQISPDFSTEIYSLPQQGLSVSYR